MKVLVIADYPRPGHQYSGHFNRSSAKALKEYCDDIQVVAHIPYFPSSLAWLPSGARWKSYLGTKRFEIHDDIAVHRPAFLFLPRLGYPYWIDGGAFHCCKNLARRLHRRIGFDAILSFDLLGTGGLAWRLGRDLRIPAGGWATGSDMRQPAGSPTEQVVTRAISQLDVVFYQSRELFEIASKLSNRSPESMQPDKHFILPRGIPEPPRLAREEMRIRKRKEFGIQKDEIVILASSIKRNKGVFELLDALSLAAAGNPRIRCLLLGSLPGFDETDRVREMVNRTETLRDRVRILPACQPEEVWEYLCAADIFAFPSRNEGMPNSLLEAMASGVPAIAFGIPPIREIAYGTSGLFIVPPFEIKAFADGILRLAASDEERVRIAETGRQCVLDRYMIKNSMKQAVGILSQAIKRHDLSMAPAASVSFNSRNV